MGDAASSFIPSLLAISHFPASPVPPPSLNLFSPADGVALYDSGLGVKKKKRKKINDGWGEVEVELGRVRVDYL